MKNMNKLNFAGNVLMGLGFIVMIAQSVVGFKQMQEEVKEEVKEQLAARKEA